MLTQHAQTGDKPFPEQAAMQQDACWFPSYSRADRDRLTLFVDIRMIDSKTLQVKLTGGQLRLSGTLAPVSESPGAIRRRSTSITEFIELPAGFIPGAMKIHTYKDLLTVQFNSLDGTKRDPADRQTPSFNAAALES